MFSLSGQGFNRANESSLYGLLNSLGSRGTRCLALAIPSVLMLSPFRPHVRYDNILRPQDGVSQFVLGYPHRPQHEFWNIESVEAGIVEIWVLLGQQKR